jgi:hypothetical protein
MKEASPLHDVFDTHGDEEGDAEMFVVERRREVEVDRGREGNWKCRKNCQADAFVRAPHNKIVAQECRGRIDGCCKHLPFIFLD